jgi:hypothetical protein
MTNTPSNPASGDQFDEQLVAYLDGELEPQSARQVENLLAGNERARSRLNELAASWDLLDQLPRATVDDLFTRTTVEMVALAAEDEVAQSQANHPGRRRLRWLEGGIAVAAAALVGFVIVSMAVPNQNELLLQDLPVVSNLDIYRSVGNIDLLKQFQSAGMFIDDALAAPTGKTSERPVGGMSDTPIVVPTALELRRATVQELSPSEKADLHDDFDKFTALPVKQQESLRQFDSQLRADPGSTQLRHIMQHYYEWLKTLSPADRAIVRESVLDGNKVDDQIKLIKQVKQSQLPMAFGWLDPGLNLLKDRDSAVVLQWMRDFAENHEQELIAGSPEAKRTEGQKSDDHRRRRPLALLSYQTWWGPKAKDAPPVTDSDIHALHVGLSPEKQQQLDDLPNLDAQVHLVSLWIRKATTEFQELWVQGYGRWGGRPPSAERLKQFEESLPTAEKKELDGLSGVERSRKLMELFQKHRRSEGLRPGGPAARQSAESAAVDQSKRKEPNSGRDQNSNRNQKTD